MLRSFAEHRSAEAVAHRTAIVENASILGLVFLNNNLHAVHHRYPGVSWYALPELYRKKRASFLADNLGLVYSGYGDIISRFLLKPLDQILHPIHSERQDVVLKSGGENDRSH